MTDEQIAEIAEKRAAFTEAAKPLIKWICENEHPHVSVIVTPTGAELLEGKITTGEVFEFVVD